MRNALGRLLLMTTLFAADGWPAIWPHTSVRAQDQETVHRLRRIDQLIQRVHARELNSVAHTPWVIMHAVIAFEQQVQVIDVSAGRKWNAIDFLCQHATYEDQRIFRDQQGLPALPTRRLSFGLTKSFQVQDHVNQFLMAFADAAVPLETRILAEGGREFRVRDLLVAGQRNFAPEQELGWTLVALAVYTEPDREWRTSTGMAYTLADVVGLAVERDTSRETEGGTHHLYGVAYALRTYQQRGEALHGPWLKARKYLDEHVELAKQLQQPDGAFSAAIFRHSSPPRSARMMVWSTGHMLEWLTVALDQRGLREPWIASAVDALLQVMEQASFEELSEGGLYHATHALIRYRDALEP